MTKWLRPIGLASLVIVLVMGLSLQAIFSSRASADQITVRSLTLEAGATDGGSKPGGVVKHLFAFTLPSVGATNVGSIKFLYCTAAGVMSDPCTMPTGLVTTSATLSNQTGATGFTMVNTTNGAPYLTRTAASVPAGTAVTYELSTVTNPTTTNKTFYVRIATYASIDTTGAITDSGTVAASTATQIVLTGTMPESLIFCAGATVNTTSGVPDCSTATPGAITFNQLFSPTDTATATSQMAASTNAGSGYSITVNGPTLTSGSNTVTAMAAAAAGVRGTSQFGLNLRANTVATSTPAVGTDVAPAAGAGGGTYKGEPATGYGTVDQFKFVSTNSVADSAFGGAGGTDAQIFTVSYIVNVPGSQPAGTYTTTLTYICTPTF
ncbi:MAG TPA: hypothetical protein VN778_00140 [Verrucomicrobiae bacterium]|nr:hypothetical protein [Verrucomicrobiae bacterium]